MPETINYFTTKTFDRCLQDACLRGGTAKKRHDKVRVVLGSLKEANPFALLSVTNNGETRLARCVKYDLGDGWRLVTQQSAKACIFLFVGDHDDTDRWLDAHKGETFGVRENQLVRIPGIGADPSGPRRRAAEATMVPLIEQLPIPMQDDLMCSLPRSVCRALEALDGLSEPGAIDVALDAVIDPERRGLLTSVLKLLLTGDVDGAIAHVELRAGKIALLEQLDANDFIGVDDGDQIRRLKIGSDDYQRWMEAFERRAEWQDWFLFLHPEQDRVVKADYNGPAQLSGVSGSGKTCVLVRRALRLAEASKEACVLLLTLNRSLAGLLRKLVDAACVQGEVRRRIKVTSLFELAGDLLIEFEPENARSYEDVTWKTNEHVDEIFREYYRCWAANEDARVLRPVHRSLTAQGISGEAYLREEFDWIRSAAGPDLRATTYPAIERVGRKIPIAADRRRDILRGLEGWERKMSAVGVIDYLGLTSALSRHASQLTPTYDHILVDEAQDFGTTELRIVRRLAKVGPNDIFLCGDVAQTVLPKHRVQAEAGVVATARERIQRNYRNSRQILAAAYDVLQSNLTEDMLDSPDLEILDPRFSNFSGPVPLALAAETLDDEIMFARTYVAGRLDQGERHACIAFAGFSQRDVKGFGDACGVAVLDGGFDPKASRLVFSDLEQTKGYEFDVLVIVGCRDGILPAQGAPHEEAFRDACKLYVAMTRARRELILSYHGAASRWIKDVAGTLAVDSWDNVEQPDYSLRNGTPARLSEVEVRDDGVEDPRDLTGAVFQFTPYALGMSTDAQDKLAELVDGRGLRAAGRNVRLKWPRIGDLESDLAATRQHDGRIGPKIADEFRAVFNRMPAAPKVE